MIVGSFSNECQNSPFWILIRRRQFSCVNFPLHLRIEVYGSLKCVCGWRFFTIHLSGFFCVHGQMRIAFLHLSITAFCVCNVSFSFTEFDWFTFSLFGLRDWYVRCAPPTLQQPCFLIHMHYCVFRTLWGIFFQTGSWECVEWFRPKIQQRCVLKASSNFEHLDLSWTRMIKSVTRGKPISLSWKLDSTPETKPVKGFKKLQLPFFSSQNCFERKKLN